MFVFVYTNFTEPIIKYIKPSINADVIDGIIAKIIIEIMLKDIIFNNFKLISLFNIIMFFLYCFSSLINPTNAII